jgi:hypothetical protein
MSHPIINQIHLATPKRKAISTLFIYVLTLFLSRLIVFLIEKDIDFPFLGYNVVRGYHIHHFTYGILLMSFITYIDFFLKRTKLSDTVYPLFGLALGLIFDEFGIWLKLDPTYNQPVSYIAAGIVGIILLATAIFEVRFARYFR